MKRISPRVLGILVIVGGVCAALPFKKLTSHRTTAQATPNSEAIEWRSHDFRLEVTAQDETLQASPYADNRPKSPAFGSPDGAVNALATLDNVAQPPALAGAYEAGGAVGLPAAGSLEDGNGQSATTPDAEGDSSTLR